ncbi:MAG: zinc metallopeptidase [Kiritimatiellaeota bacterium]|nr:zinc metallopeptidase [Kiritimatiellota bacterium]
MFQLMDPTYLMMMVPVLVLAGIAQMMVKSAFAKYSKTASYSGLTGAQAAERMLRGGGVFDVSVEQSKGFLSDHYDPSRKALRLSPDVYGSSSLAAVGIACHEAGHALQHAEGYMPLTLRTVLVPVTSLSSNLAIYVFFLGMMFRSDLMVLVGCGMFAVAFVFALVTLPVEWDASARAKQHIVMTGVVSPTQEQDAAKVLNAAFLTYVAGAVASLMTLLYYLMRAKRR